jgi:HK97 family phage major capsid protein
VTLRHRQTFVSTHVPKELVRRGWSRTREAGEAWPIKHKQELFKRVTRQELERHRQKAIDDARAILDKADRENRDISDFEKRQWDGFMAEADRLKREVPNAITRGMFDAHAREHAASLRSEIASDPEYREAFWNYLRMGPEQPVDQRRILERGFVQAETRALGTNVTTAGGYTVPQSFYDKIVDAQLSYGGMTQVATILKTTDGRTLPIPTDNDTASIGTLVAENTVVAEQDVAFGQVSLSAYMYSSKIVRVSYQLLQDSVVDIESLLGNLLGIRLIRAINSHLTVGTGSGPA